MNIIKKLSASLAAATLFVNKAFAVGSDLIREDAKIDAAASGTLGQNVTGIINYFLGILGLVAVAFLIYAGVLMVTAGGNDEQISKAKKVITYAVIGIVIILLSYTIVTFVASSLG